MPIVASSIIEDRSQIDGRRAVTERHIDHLGEAHDIVYLAESADDVNAIMLARRSQIDQQLTDAEIQANLAEIEA